MIDEIKKIRSILPKKQKKALVILSFLVLLGMFFEILGLGMLLPVMNILLNPQSIIDWINSFSQIDISIYSYDQILIFSLSLISIIYLLKTFFLIFLTYKQNFIIESIGAYIQMELFNKYLNQPYREYLDRNLSKTLKDIQIESVNFNLFIKGILTFMVELSFVISIIFTILIIEPKGAIVVGCFFGILAICYLQITKSKIKIWGDQREILDSIISKNLVNSLSGIKEVKLFQKEEFFLKKFKIDNLKKVKISSNYITIVQISRFYFELIALIGIVILILTLVYNDFDKSKIVTLLGVFVAGAFRMIPSINRIISSLQTLKYYNSSVKTITTELNGINIKPRKKVHPFKFTNQFKINQISFSYNKQLILDNIELEIIKGETIGIIGETGSGKSTFVDLINGLLKPSEGNITVDNIDIENFLNSWQKSIGYVGQDIYLIDDTIKANVSFGNSNDKIDDNALNNALNASQLTKFINGLEDGLDSKVGDRGIHLSGGQKQRIGIARALYNNPELLIFDEATASLDNQTEKNVMDSIYNLKLNKTIIIIAHRISTLDRCDKIFKLQNKKLIRC